MKIDPVIIELRVELDQYQRRIEDARRIADRNLGAIEARGRKMGEGLRSGFGLAKVAAAGFIANIGISTITTAITQGLEYAASLGEVATQLGVTTSALQEYRYAGSQAGLATEEIDMALGQLTRRIGEGVNGTKAQADAFQKLGISLKNANGDVIATGDAIPLIAEGLKKLKSPAEQSALLLDLFGKSGQKLLPLLSQGAAGVNGLRDAAQKLGVVLSSEQIAKADETADKLDALKQVLAAKIAGTVADNASSILELANALAELVGGIGSAIKAYKQLREQFAIGVQAGIGAGLPGGLGAQFTASAIRRQGKVQSDAARAKFEGVGLPARNAPARSNFAAQSDPFADFAKSIEPAQNKVSVAQASKTKLALTGGQSELLAITTELISLTAELLDSTEARVEAEKFAAQTQLAEAITRVNANTDLSAKQKELAILGQEQIAAARIELANAKLAQEEKEKQAEAARDIADLADIESDIAIAALEDQYDLAKSNKERLRLALAIVDAETDASLAAIDNALLEEDITEAKIAQLQATRAGILAEQEHTKRSATQGNQGAVGQYRDDLRNIDPREQAERFGVDALKDLNDGLADAIVNGGSLGDVLEDTGKRFIKQLIAMALQLLIIKPLMESLGGGLGGGTGGGGFLSNLLSAVGTAMPRASGGPVTAGRTYRVNETQREFFRPDVNGKILTMSQMKNAVGSGGGSQPIILKVYADEGSMFVPRIEQISGDVSVQIVQAVAPSIVDASANEALRRGGRPRL